MVSAIDLSYDVCLVGQCVEEIKRMLVTEASESLRSSRTSPLARRARFLRPRERKRLRPPTDSLSDLGIARPLRARLPMTTEDSLSKVDMVVVVARIGILEATFCGMMLGKVELEYSVGVLVVLCCVMIRIDLGRNPEKFIYLIRRVRRHPNKVHLEVTLPEGII